jgi:hypothetical protein
VALLLRLGRWAWAARHGPSDSEPILPTFISYGFNISSGFNPHTGKRSAHELIPFLYPPFLLYLLLIPLLSINQLFINLLFIDLLFINLLFSGSLHGSSRHLSRISPKPLGGLRRLN